MKVLSLFIFFTIIAAIFAAASSFDDQIQKEKQSLQELANNHLTNKHRRNLITNTKNLSLSSASWKGCIEMTSCRVCGNFCGPGWCSNEYISEQQCVATGVWGIPPEAAEQCVDGCCRTHDHCCGAGLDRPVCNRNIVSCIDAGGCSGLCATAVHVALKIVSHFCCGDPCPTFSADKEGNFIQMDLSGKRFCDSKNELGGMTVAFGSNVAGSDDPDVSLFSGDVKFGNIDCATSVDVALHQGNNHVAIGTKDYSAQKLNLPETCTSQSETAKQLASEGSKIWYFPYTKELFVKNAKTNSYHTMEQC